MAEVGNIGSAPIVPPSVAEEPIAYVPLGTRGYTPNVYKPGGTGDGGGNSGTGTGMQTGTQTGTSSSAGGTNVFNDLNGRDPDLIHGGETIKLADGKTYTTTDSDTLESVARKTGNSVSQLMQQNGMNAALYGKNDSGKYFSVGKMTTGAAPHPVPGTTVIQGAVPEVASTGSSESAKAALAVLLKFADGLADGQESKALVQRAIDNPGSITAKDAADLQELETLMKNYDASFKSVDRQAVG
jgi:LysM repeat protein